jgi:hypothetical protein
MTPRQIQLWRQWVPIVTVLVTAGMVWATLRNDVADSVRIPRFEAESLKTAIRFRDQQRELDAIQANQKVIRENQRTLDAICKAVRCK